MNIKEFLSKKDFQFPIVPTGKAETIKEMFDNCIKYSYFPNTSIVEQWHDLLVAYSDDHDSIKLSRLYESRKVNNEWDTRRGMQTIMADNYSYAFASNHFARIIYSMAYAGFVPQYNDFKNMFLEHDFSLYSYIGTTENEKKYASFKNKTYNPCFYTQGWYLAHIISVNDIGFYGFPNTNIKNLLTPGILSDWCFSNNVFIRRINSNFTDNEKKIINAHFLRFIDPINYFLVPNQKNINQNTIGENKDLINFMIKRNHELYKNKFDNFLEKALVNKTLIPKESLNELGNKKIQCISFSVNENSKIKTAIADTPIIKKKNNGYIQDNSDMLFQIIKQYQNGIIDKGFFENKLEYQNQFIDVIAYSHSNKWLNINHTEMGKMWSIIYKPIKDFSVLSGWNKLQSLGNIEITRIKKGQHTGNYAIRIRGMKKAPNDDIIIQILDYIFNDC